MGSVSELNILSEVPEIVDDLWQNVAPEIFKYHIDAKWLNNLNKFLPEYAQVIAMFRQGKIDLQVRTSWDEKFREILDKRPDTTKHLPVNSSPSLIDVIPPMGWGF